MSSGITPTPTYDANGNQTTATPASLTWNALNLPITVATTARTTTATYDALGRMVEMDATVSPRATGAVYRPDGALLAIYNWSSGLTKGQVPLPGGSTAIYNASGLSYIRHKDWLGSSRLATTWAHAVYSKEAYAPFGETYNEAGTADRSFTGQDQDVVTGSGGTGVYDFLFRKYDPSAGRWMSPDPAGWKAVNRTDPQSMNRYAYVENQPMNATDPDGLMLCISNTVSSDGKLYGYDSGDGNACAAGFWAYQAPTETVGINGDTGDSCGTDNTSACAPTSNPSSPGTPSGGPGGNGGGGGAPDGSLHQWEPPESPQCHQMQNNRLLQMGGCVVTGIFNPWTGGACAVVTDLQLANDSHYLQCPEAVVDQSKWVMATY